MGNEDAYDAEADRLGVADGAPVDGAPSELVDDGGFFRFRSVLEPCDEDVRKYDESAVARLVGQALDQADEGPAHDAGVGRHVVHCVVHVAPDLGGGGGVPPILGLGVSLARWAWKKAQAAQTADAAAPGDVGALAPPGGAP